MTPLQFRFPFGLTRRSAVFILAAINVLVAVSNAPAQTTLRLAATNLFGGAGDQRATAASILGGTLYFSGVSAANGGDGLVASYALPMTNNAAPLWSAIWPGLAGGDDFNGVAASAEGVYVAGGSYGRTTDSAGGKENKGITVKFPLNGATGGGFGGATWDRQTPAGSAMPYGGSEGLFASLSTVESGNTFAYATGSGQQNGANGGRLFISKLNASGTVLWTRDDSATMVNNAYSIGRGLVALNGNIYVAGFNGDSGSRACLRKYDLNGTLLWSRTTTTGQYLGVTALGGSLFAVGQVGSGASGNFLVDKWDEAGNLSWSQQYDRNNAEDMLTAVVGFGGRIYAAGSTRGTTAGGADAALLEIDPANGSLLSTTLYGGTQDDFANGIATDGTDLYLVGETRSFVAGGNGAGQNDAFVLRYTAASAPNITGQPQSQSVPVGSNATFSVTATGAGTLTYQWQFHNTNLAFATNPAVTITNCQPSDAGDYLAIVSYSGSSATSAIATLTVLVPPSVTNQPVNQTASANGSVTFNVGVTGTGPFTYQWLSNGTNIAGATGASLTLSNLSALQAGSYSVLISNSAGYATSVAALLTVVDLKMYAGINIGGVVGTNYSVEAASDLAGTNWLNLTNIVLPASPYLFIDTDSPQHPHRFYRAVPVP